VAGSEREEKMFAVIKTGGKQYRVAADDLIEIDKIAGEAGEAVAFADVLLVGGEETVLGTPTVAGASVRGEVVEQDRKPKVIAFKKRRRKNSRRKRGHRQEFTVVRITEILTEGKKDQLKSAKPKIEVEAKDPADKGATEVKPKVETATTADKAAVAAPSSEKAAGAETEPASSALKSRAETKTPRASASPGENTASDDNSK
jgi:large subunit ribosomal protein L21